MLQSSTCKKPGISAIRSACMNENGAVLVIALAFMALLTMLGTTAVLMTTTDMKIGANYKDSERAFNDAQAGVQYAIGKMEEGLKAWPRTFTLPTSSTAATPLISTFTVPSGFGFTYPSEITQISTDPDIYQFVTSGTGAQNSTASITVGVQRLPAIQFGAFGDNKLEMKNDSSVYSYSHDDCLVSGCFPPVSGDSTGEGDVGSNNSVILNNNAIVDGDSAVGEDVVGTDGSYKDLGATVNGEENVDIARVDPDPLGVVGGEYAANFTTYAAANDNGTAIEGDNYYSSYTVGGIGTTIDIDGKDTLTLKGIAGGANFYVTDIDLKSNSILFIDTTNGPVNIYLVGAMNVANGAEVVNVEKPVGGCDGTSGACECADVGPPSFACAPCFQGDYKIGAPSNFSIFSNSTSGISIGNSTDFSGLIYAPYAEIRFDNAVNIYGAVWGKDVELVANTTIYFDTGLKDNMESNDMAIVSWRDNRM